MLKLMGSKRVIIQCLECETTSEPFYVTLADSDEDGRLYYPKSEPTDWIIPDDEGLNEDIIYGYCPKHKHLMGGYTT